MKASIPTMTTAGWVSNPATAVTILFDYFLGSESNQSYFFPDEISSFPKLIQEYGSEPRTLSSRVETQLHRLYSRYFDGVRITVSTNESFEDKGRYNLTINLTAIDGDSSYSLAKVLDIVGSRILDVYDKGEYPQYRIQQ